MEKNNPFQPAPRQPGRHRSDPVLERELFDSDRPPSPGKRRRFEQPNSNHKSVHRPFPPVPPAAAPFKRSGSGLAAPTAPFTAAARPAQSFARYNQAKRNPPAVHASSRPQHTICPQFPPPDDRYLPTEGPPSERPGPSHTYGNGIRPPHHTDSPARSNSQKGAALAIANPNHFPSAPKSWSRISYERSHPADGKTERVRRRIPGVPPTQDMDMFGTRDNDKHDRKPRAGSHKAPDKPDVVCIDTEDRLERPASAQREAAEKPPLSSRPKSTKDATRKKKTGLRSQIPPSVPLSKISRSSRLKGSHSTPSRENGGVRGSQRLPNKPTSVWPLIKIPNLKNAAKRKYNDHDANGEATQDQQMRGGKRQRAVEPVDVDGPDSAESEKSKCRSSSVLEKLKKLFLVKNDLKMAMSDIETCLRERKPFIELSFRGTEDTELSTISDIRLTEDYNVTRVLNLSYNRLTKISNSVSEWFVPLHLWHLDLAGNHIQILQGVEHYVNLRVLDLSRNELSTIPKEVTQLSNLRVLDVRQNALTSLPGGFRKLIQLQLLNVSVNHLKTLPEDFAEQGSILSCLDLSDNPSFQEFPMCVEKLSKLEDLRMGGTLVEGMTGRGDTILTAAELLSHWAGLDLDKLKDRKEQLRSRRGRVTDTDGVQEAL